MKRKLVWVKWRDASFLSMEWTQQDGHKLAILETAGFLTHQDKEAIYIGGDYDAEDDRWRGVTAIPLVNIIKKKVLTVDG